DLSHLFALRRTTLIRTIIAFLPEETSQLAAVAAIPKHSIRRRVTKSSVGLRLLHLRPGQPAVEIISISLTYRSPLFRDFQFQPIGSISKESLGLPVQSEHR